METSTNTTFTKDDFMSARDLVKKLDKKYDIETIKSAMATEFKRGMTAVFVVN